MATSIWGLEWSWGIQCFICALGVTCCLLGASSARASDIVLVRDGEPEAALVAASDAGTAAERFNESLEKYTGTRLPVAAPGAGIDAGQAVLVFCTEESRREVADLLPEEALRLELEPEGFALAGDPGKGRLVLMGADRAGLRYAAGELWNYHVRLDGRTATAPAEIRVVDAPAFSKRILWTWDCSANWDDDLRDVHQTRDLDPGATQYPYEKAPGAFEMHFERLIDFGSEHKLNGLIIWGFLRDVHGGVEAGQRLSAYAKERHVRILPGVGTVFYGGYYCAGDSQYSIGKWLADHPEVKRMVFSSGETVEAPCPSDPRTKAWLAEGARWFFSTFRDIGGVNLEHGDFFECYCETCRAEREKPENDSNFYWDMMETQVPVVKIAREMNPELWLTYATYTGYTKEMMEAPPLFLKQFPEYAIVQWTYTDLVDREGGWTEDMKPPAGAKHSIGLIHHGSAYHRAEWAAGARRTAWWGSPGQAYALVPEVIQQVCQRALRDGSEGLEIEGEVGAASPQNELNYLAMEEFTWHPEQTVEGWIGTRLPALYGGEKLARRFYELVSDETTCPEAIEAAGAEAEATAETLKDARHARRWRNLAAELRRRLALAKAGKTEHFDTNFTIGNEEYALPW